MSLERDLIDIEEALWTLEREVGADEDGVVDFDSAEEYEAHVEACHAVALKEIRSIYIQSRKDEATINAKNFENGSKPATALIDRYQRLDDANK